MLFRFVLLAALAFHAAFCVAQNPEKNTVVELIFSDESRLWATLRIDKDKHKRLIQVGKWPSGDSEYASCEVLRAKQRKRSSTVHQCRIRVGCDNGNREMACIVVHSTTHRRLKDCGATTEDELQIQYLPECNTNLKISETPVVVDVRNPDDNSNAVKQLALFRPVNPSHLPHPYKISKEVLLNNAPRTEFDCDELPTGELGDETTQDGERCALLVRCWFEARKMHLWPMCQVHIFRDGALLGRCYEEIPEGLEGCHV